MAQDERKNPPDEDSIAFLLNGFRPTPGARYYQQMEAAPWNRQQRLPFFRYICQRPFAPALVTATFVILILVGGMLVSPSFRAVAQQIMYFFMSEPDDQIDVLVTISPAEDANTFGSEGYFSLTIAEAEGLTGYPISQISQPPTGSDFLGAHYHPDSHAVILLYAGEGYQLLLTQRPLGKVEEYFSIGASAVVEPVLVRGTQGEYVAGGWKLPSDDQPANQFAPGTQVNLDAYWDVELSQYTLRWQENDMAFEMRSSGQNAPQKEELVNIAAIIK